MRWFKRARAISFTRRVNSSSGGNAAHSMACGYLVSYSRLCDCAKHCLR